MSYGSAKAIKACRGQILCLAIFSTSSLAYAADVVKISLAEALQRGRENSHVIEQNRQLASAARDKKLVAASKFFPTVSAELDAGTLRDHSPVPGAEPLDEFSNESRDYNKYRGALVLRQSIFNGLSDFKSYQMASDDVILSDTVLNDKVRENRQQIIESYFEIQLDLAKILSEEEVQNTREQQLTFSTNKYRAGASTELDVLRAKYEWESQKPTIAKLRSELEKKKLRFSHLIGLKLDQPFELTVSLEQADATLRKQTSVELPQALAAALEGNTRIKTLQQQRQKLEHELGQIRSKHGPSVDFVLSAESIASLREDIGTEKSRKYSAMIELKVPLFSGLSSFHERSEGSKRLAESDAAFEDAKQTLLQVLSAAVRDFKVSGISAEINKSNIALAEKTVAQSRAQYNAGRSTLTDVLDTYSKLVAARKDYAQALFDGIKAITTIQTIAGKPIEASQIEGKKS